MEKFKMKRPIKADYIRKFGFEGETIWRWELLKYNEAKNAFENQQKNMKDFHEKVKSEEKIRKTLLKGKK